VVSGDDIDLILAVAVLIIRGGSGEIKNNKGRGSF